jgi:hypothetical protein
MPPAERSRQPCDSRGNKLRHKATHVVPGQLKTGSLAARGQWVTNEKTLIDRAGLRSIDEILTGLTAEPGHLLTAIDNAAALLCFPH